MSVKARLRLFLQMSSCAAQQCAGADVPRKRRSGHGTALSFGGKVIVKYSLVLLLLIPMFSVAAEAPIEDEVKLESLAKQSPKMYLPKLVELNEKKLREVFAETKSNSSVELAKALDDAQDAWWKFYRADSVVASFDAEGGSYQMPAQYEHRLYQLRLRIYQLKTPFLSGWVYIPKVTEK